MMMRSNRNSETSAGRQEVVDRYSLDSVEIENFRQYRHAKIKFSTDSNKPFTVLEGDNGAGKTNIMNAITWCLYGEEKHRDEGNDDYPTTHKNALRKKPNGVVRTRVTLMINNKEGNKYRLERNLSIYGNGEGQIVYDKGSNTHIVEGSTPTTNVNMAVYDKRHGWEPTEFVERKVEELLPTKLSQYFLFDGEKLEEFFRQADEAKHGIEDVTQIDLVDHAIENFEKFSVKMGSGKRKKVPEVEMKQANMEAALEDLEDAKKVAVANKGKLTVNAKHIRELKRRIGRFGVDIRELQAKSEVAAKKIADYENKLESAEKELQTLVLSKMAYVKILPTITDVMERIKTMVKEGTVPEKIKHTFLKELLERKMCICGNDISPGKPSHEMVSSMLEMNDYSAISEIAIGLKFELGSMLKLDDVKRALSEKETLINDLEDELVIARTEHADLKKRRGKRDDEEYDKLNAELDAHETEREELNRERGRLEGRIDKLDFEYRAKHTEFTTECRKHEEYKAFRRNHDFSENALKLLKTMRGALVGDVRNIVQTHTKNGFLNIITKDEYTDMVIDEDYKLTVLDKNGLGVSTSLSKGEKLVLALSFIAALRQVTGFRFPLLIDTPFGRISGMARRNIAKFFPEMFKDTQATFLVTDTEYRAEPDNSEETIPSIRGVIGHLVGASYKITFKDGESVVERN